MTIATEAGATCPPEIWPSVGEYPIYDPFLYYALDNDHVRNAAYKRAIRSLASGRTAVDIGTGPELNWARACAEAGAARVYAIEAIPESCEKARRRIRELGLAGRIDLIEGNSTEIELPEKVDLCVSEIIGMVASSEGVAAVLQDAKKRFLGPGGRMIPERCATSIAACSIADFLAAGPGFGRDPRSYLESIFTHLGHPMDVRLCLRGQDAYTLLSDTDFFEDLDLTGDVDLDYHRSLRLTVDRSGRCDGFLLWMHLWCRHTDPPLDALDGSTSWLPVFFPVFYPGVQVERGDRIEVRCETALSDNGRNPDYRVSGTLVRRSGRRRDFTFDSPHHGRTFRQNAFYQALFADRS